MGGDGDAEEETTPAVDEDASEVNGDAHTGIPASTTQTQGEGVASTADDAQVASDGDVQQTPSDRINPGEKAQDKDGDSSPAADPALAAPTGLSEPAERAVPFADLSGTDLPAVPSENDFPETPSGQVSAVFVAEQPSSWKCGSLESGVSSSLARFVRFTDFVPCDFNEDGVVDILALSSQLSTAFVYEGASTGVFTEGASLDLPFRPACSLRLPEEVGLPGAIFLVSGTGLVSLFVPIHDREGSGATSHIRSARLLRIEDGTATVAVVDASEDEATLYQVSATGALEVGRAGFYEISDPFEWYLEFSSWDGQEGTPLPILPSNLEKITVLADLRGSYEMEMILYHDGSIEVYAFEQGEAVCLGSIECPSRPEAIRVADLDRDGASDLLWLEAGVLRVVFGQS